MWKYYFHLSSCNRYMHKNRLNLISEIQKRFILTSMLAPLTRKNYGGVSFAVQHWAKANFIQIIDLAVSVGTVMLEKNCGFNRSSNQISIVLHYSTVKYLLHPARDRIHVIVIRDAYQYNVVTCFV